MDLMQGSELKQRGHVGFVKEFTRFLSSMAITVKVTLRQSWAVPQVYALACTFSSSIGRSRIVTEPSYEMPATPTGH